MTPQLRHTLLALLSTFLFLLSASAQSGNIRYVSTTGKNSNDGLSWANAKKDIQEAINDLAGNNLTGEVWVAAGTYYPTETTESTTSLYYKAFKIPAGITVRGGFTGSEATAGARAMTADKNFGDGTKSETIDGETFRSGVYTNKTILCGDLTPGKEAKLEWNDKKQQFDPIFYGNSYHVVWFAMNGFDAKGRANPLAKPAKLEGCVIEGGHANNREVLAEHPHTAYGGGIYMVLNSFVYNCEVKNCDASRNGGGIYMDGGGVVRRTYVHDCQALGLGTDFGYGGGICQYGGALTAKERPCVVAQSAVTNCVGRMGGGIGIMADQTNSSGKYAVVSNSTLVNNCTATIEGGGVYTYKGGGVASLTIVNNKCNGSGITQGGTVTGQTGGLYSYDAAYIANTVIWGNKCEANNDVQFASARSSLTDSEKCKFYHNALSRMDNANWSNVLKMGVISLADENTSGSAGSKGYPLFFKPTASAGYLAGIDANDIVSTDTDAEKEEKKNKWTNWTVSSESSLCFAGIATSDLDTEELTPAPQGISYDMQLGALNARPTIGALISQTGTLAPATNVTYNSVTYATAFFVDPGFIYGADNTGSNGTDWEHPALFLGNVLDYITLHPDQFTSTVAIFVKEGTVDNTRAWSNSRVRQTSLEVPSNVAIFGSFNSHLTGTNLNMQHVVQTPTVITGQLMNDYQFNIPHLLVIKDKQNIFIEGFKFSFANASSTLLGNSNTDGAAITIDNSRDIRFRNIIVSNCTADHGAAVYANNATTTKFENCIFHNNESKVLPNSGIIYATNGSALTFDHCDVLRNVGHASYLGTNSATNSWSNSIFYGNLSKAVDDTNIDHGSSDSSYPGLNPLSLAAFSGTTARATGHHCMFDARSATISSQFGGNDTGNQWQYNLQYAFIDGTGQGYPRFINPTKNAGVTQDGDATYYGRATSFEPHNNNPAVNVASDANPGKDIINITRNYGGLPDIGAVENHEAKRSEEGENAYADGQKKLGDVLYVRDYSPTTGTQIDTYDYDGASTYTKNNDGKGIYRQTSSGSGEYELLDGSSWERAINGNADYTLSGTHTYKDTNSEAVLAYKINNGTSPNQYYLDINNGTLNRVNSKTINVPVINPETGQPMTDSGGNQITEPYNPADHCTVFILCDADGKDILYDSGKIPTAAKRLKDASTGEFLYLDYVKSNNTYTFRTSANPPADQATATITASGTNYRIAYKANNTTKYISNANTIPGTTQTAWTFTSVSLSVDHGTGTEKNDIPYDMGSFKGLQYAVNKAHVAYKDDLSYSGDPATAKKQVWVGAGVYQRNPEINSASNTSGFTTEHVVIEMDNENCFIIQDGVDVYGAFPKTGNPGMNEREALVSQYVHVLPERGINNVADYETILEPATKGMASGVKRRVLGQPYKYNPDKGNDTKRGTPLYCGTDYVSVVWDGFTLRDGVWDSKGLNRPNRYGGAGAAIYRNVTLKNAIVTNNTTIYSDASASQDFRAGGVYMDGGVLDAGYVINNLMEGWKSSSSTAQQSGAAYGAGMYIYTGTVFNSVIANNRIFAAYSDGAGAFIENANFFNNTIVNNKAEGTNRASGGIAVWTDPGRGTESTLTLYNCIIVGNDGTKSSALGNKDVCLPREGFMKLYNCISNGTTTTTSNPSKFSITFEACDNSVTDYTEIFKDYYAYGTADKTFQDLDLRLKSTASNAINQGNESPVIGGTVYSLIDYNDMDFAERIQDCRIDIGAYEFNGATSITPDLTTVPGQAIYYVTPEGYGTTDAHDPANAACAEKLQRVLDAAGRYKYLNPSKQVIVKVANSYDFLHPNNGTLGPKDDGYVQPVNFTYYATRTTNWTDQDVRIWSIIVPRGVEVWGGYTDIALNDDGTEYKVDSKRVWNNTYNGFVFNGTSRRNITKYPTYFDSYYLNKLEKMDANTYHVVTFTDRIFDLNGYAYTKADFEGKTDEEIGTILQKGSASTYLQILDNDESRFVHLSEPIGGLKGFSGNVIMEGSSPKNFGTAETPKYASNRAVIDGIFVSGGQADAPSSSTTTTLNINSYGGAALVNDFAYVRNCILTGNTAINGGALALTDQALVSGCLILDNVAHNQGGGIYVFEEGAKLSNGTTITSLQQGGDITMDQRMAHVLTSTIVRNRAQQGGGVWYTDNVNANARFNSVAIWQNEAVDQPNVYGMVNPEQPTTDETISEIYYPFCYSAIQDIRASGTNNQNTASANSQGVRFVHKDSDIGQTSPDKYVMATEQTESGHEKYEEFGYYGLTNYSILCSTGMPKSMYGKLQAAIAIADDDILATNRIHDGKEFVEIGARALKKEFPTKQLMLRLFVAQPEDVDKETVSRFMKLEGDEPEEYYSQEGSSFAYPFNFLQDALDYVKDARNSNKDARNLPFEILVGKGEWYPNKDLNGSSASVWAHTFAIPEGVTIVGGFNPTGGNGTYYGRYNKPVDEINKTPELESSGNLAMSIYNNVEPIPTGTQSASGDGEREIGRGHKSGNESVTLPAVGSQAAQEVIFQQWDIQDICDRRAMEDNNKNGIIEPWEFKHQTIISGNAVNGETDGVYHIMTAVADADAVGNLPAAGYRYNVTFPNDAAENGYKCWEYGQQIRLNGLIITGGNALTYLSTALDEYGKYMFYHGAGLLVDGNRYKANIDAPSASHTEPTFHNSAAYGLGYRDIPISVINCQFRNNKAGYGGAISTNGTLDTYASSFEQNLAIGQTEEWKSGEKWFTMVSGSRQDVTRVMYPGQGGAIHATGQLSCYNTLFANNEARLGEGEDPTIDLVRHPTFRVPLEGNASATLRAAGGAVMVGTAGRYHMMNCDFVRNKANAYPVIFTMNPNSTEDEKGKDEPTSTENYNQIVSTVVWGNEVNPDILNKYKDNQYYQFASKLMVNVGKKSWRTDGYPAYSPSFTADHVPSSQADLNANWKEFVWFSAYEDGVGFTQNNTYDLRDHIIFKTGQFVNWNIKQAAKNVAERMAITIPDGYFQNCNIQIVAKNDDVAGPNFGYPSVKAGYDGFMEGADWSPARFNRLTDNGSGWIKQTVTQTVSDFVVTFNDKDTPGVGETKDDYYQGGYPVAHYDTYPEYKLWLAIGNEKYMQATNDNEKDEIFINNTSIGRPNKNYPRISPDPTMGVTKAYIDIGVYEYQKQPLLKPGSEVDILWVSTKEHPENGAATGATWRTPTSDLQRAINTLLSSRNGHKKEIRIMEGEYAPVTPQTIGDTKYNAFVIDTKSLNEATITPTGFTDGNNNNQYYAQSLTIKGGYSSEIMYEHDPAQYKTVIRQNEGANGINSDHLIYIKDPTMRYAYGTAQGYTDNNDGATFGSNTSAESYTARTMPIQLDGITLINDAAAADAKGSAIYYPDYTGASPITQAHSISVGGKVVYYETQEEMDKVNGSGNHTGTTVNHETEFAIITTEGAGTIQNPAKLVITKTQVVGSGKPNVVNTGSAVYIGQNGGSALIYNSVFHSNYGMPLDACNTVNVNNTFGINAGMVRLQDASGVTVKSQMHNSVLWRNNPTDATTYGDQIHYGDVIPTITGSQTTFTYNAYTGGNTTANDYTEPSGTVAGNNYNVGLTDTNFDIGNGPNFVDPENVDIEARNFDIKPSVRLLNKGNGTRTPAVAPATDDTYAGLYNEKIVSQKYDYSLASTYDKDALYRTRIVGSGSTLHIDLGAYEFQGGFINPLYVDPNKAHSDAATGENWDKAFGYGDIQSAMDLAALYHIDNPSKEAYVFVKGASATNQGMHTNEELSIRDGVTVYGSIISTYSDWHGMEVDHVHKYGDGGSNPTTINAFIADMASIREGVASHVASKTVVSSIKTPENSTYDGTTNGTPALIDGFVVTDPGKPIAPVLDITNTSEKAVIAVRNVIVADNDLSEAASGTNVAQISNGLLYEALLRDNKQATNGAALQVSSNGYAVNVTVEGKTIGADSSEPIDGDAGATAEQNAHIFNSITNSINSGSGANAEGAAAPYRAITNKDISGYFYNIGDANLNYQLTETSKYIDMCPVSNPLVGVANNLAPFINYTTDRDLLGNPRLLTGVTTAGKIDRGAFETWKVKNEAGKFLCGELGTIADAAYNTTYNNPAHAIIKKHFYPHDGSVCYIMEGQSLVIDPFDPAHEVKPTPHNPGFMLVQEGANFYGNGRPATCAYVSVERTINKENGSIISMPYDMKYGSDVTLPVYDGEGRLANLQAGVTKGIYSYDGAQRSAWDYIFEPTASPCWSALIGDATTVEANHGVLVTTNASGSEEEVTLRFTAKGNNLQDYIYTENGPSKTVTLTQYDDKVSDNGDASFTDKEDMGWNCIGLPYLVSDYRPYEKVNTSTGRTDAEHGTIYRLDIPHILWLYYDGVTSRDGKLVDGDGGYYSVKSRDADSWHTAASAHTVAGSDARLWVGEGFFTQTATVFGSETLTFYLPDPTASGASPSNRRNIRFYFNDDDDDNDDTSDDYLAPTLLRTEYYSVAGRRLARPDTMGVTIVRRIYSDGTVRSFKTR